MADFVETYKGHDIYYYYPGEYPGYQDDGYATAAIDQLYAYLPDLKSAIDIITEPPPEPPVVSSVTIGLPFSAERNTNFEIWGHIKDQYNIGMSGETVYIYQGGSLIATVSTNVAGRYSKIHSISSTGVYTLSAICSGISASRNITITAPCPPPPPPDILTSLTISAPNSVEPDETFNITGILYETGTGLPLPNQIIDLSYNGVILGSTLTGIDGDYLIQAFISTEGTYTLMAAFAGTTTLGASQATSRLTTGGLELTTLLPLAVVGFLAYIMIFRK